MASTWHTWHHRGSLLTESHDEMNVSRSPIPNLFLLLLWITPQLAIADVCVPVPEDRPRIALVLGGGGARGAAHIGVMQALEELRVPVDLIVGTSMGALVGGLHASGMSPDDLELLIAEIDWSDIFSDKTRRRDRRNQRKRDDTLGLYGAKIGLSKGSSTLPAGAVAGQKIMSLLETLVAQRDRSEDFDDLPIPFRAVAVDILAAETVVLDSGRLSQAMRASMAIPAVFDPVVQGDRLLVDGGVLMNLPVSVAKDLGADVVIAIDVGSALAGKDSVKNLLQVLYQLTGVVTVVNTRQQKALLGEDDIFLQPPIDDDVTTGSFDTATQAVPSGYEAAMEHRARLSELALGEPEWQRREMQLDICLDGPPVIRFVEINNQSRFDDSVIERRLNIELGTELDFASLDAQVQEIYALGFLQRVSYEIVDTERGTGVKIDVLPDLRGTEFLEYGIGINSTDLVSSFNLRLGFLKTDVGKYGGEFRGLVQIGQDLGGLVELYQPLGPGLNWVVVPQLAAERSNLTVFDDAGNSIYELQVNERIAELAFGREIGVRASIFGGLRTGEGDVGILIGDPGFPAFDFKRGEYFLRFGYDTQDNIFFPGDGTFGELEIVSSDDAIGAYQEFEQIESLLVTAWTFDRHSIMASATVELSSDDAIPVQNLYRSGGFPRMSGFNYNELIGENFGMVLAGYRYKLLESGLFPGYLGGTIEYGNVAKDRRDLFSNGILNGSVYFGIDSIIGPMYFGVGYAEGRDLLPFLTIGSIFSRSSLVR